MVLTPMETCSRTEDASIWNCYLTIVPTSSALLSDKLCSTFAGTVTPDHGLIPRLGAHDSALYGL